MNDLFEKSEFEVIREMTQSFHTEEGQGEDLERVSLDRSIDETNKGYQLLLKMGWKANTGLGRRGQGIKEPIRINVKDDSLGVGKRELEEEMSNPENIKRKQMEYEKVETFELKQKRAQDVQLQEQRKRDLEEITDSFHCKLCNKRYKRISEYEAHLSSYDHNHTKRLSEAKALNKNRQDTGRKRKVDNVDEFAAVMKRANAVAAQNKVTNINPPPPAGPPPDEPAMKKQKTTNTNNNQPKQIQTQQTQPKPPPPAGFSFFGSTDDTPKRRGYTK